MAARWVVRGRDLLEGRPFALMGVVNLTPDSFSDGGRHLEPQAALDHALRLAGEGADLLDLGAESSRPGSDPVTTEEEWRRLGPALERIRSALPDLPLSVDTTKAEVARRSLDAGADAVNDISAGLLDPAMLPLICQRGAALVLMHMRGVPKSMQEEPQYSDAPREVAAYLGERLAAALRAGVAGERIALDPGIGFGKRTEDNLALLSDLSQLLAFGRPVLIGASRKSVIGALTGAPIGERLPGTIALHVAALLGGARIFRVHDVAAHRQALLCAAAVAAAQKSIV